MSAPKSTSLVLSPSTDSLALVPSGPSKHSSAAHPLTSWNLIAGLVLNLVACQFFSCMHASAKQLYNISSINPWEVIYWRSIVLVLGNVLVAWSLGKSAIVIPRKLSFIVWMRVITGVLGMYFLFYQTKVMSFSKATTIFFTYPAFAMSFAYLVMGERITRYDIITAMVSFVGVISIVFDPSADHMLNHKEHELWYAPIYPILAAIFCAMTDVYTRALGSDVHYTVSPTLFGGSCGIVAPLFIGLNFESTGTVTPYTPSCIFYLTLMAVPGLIGQLLLTRAFQLEKAGRLAVVSYVQVVNACLIDITIFGMSMHLFEYLGVFLIVGSNVTLMILKGCDIIA
ncbi:MAG: DMT family transporter [Candidatus Pacebacteria bacterium]|nr:DMT family transporter [Candidatus Paceibacterota bacterium]